MADPDADPVAAVAAPQHLGGVDLHDYCRSRGHVHAQLTGSTAYDWHCVTPGGGQADIHFNVACQWRYPERLTIDRIANFHNPYSFQCWQVNSTSSSGMPDFAGYCKAQGKDDAVLTGTTAYDWYCVDTGPQAELSPIYVYDACYWTLGVATIDRFASFYAPWSWQCWI